MKISQLYTYPIKSLRGVSLPEAELTSTGFKYDRRFMLLKVKQADGGSTTLHNMHVPHFPEMSLFLTDLVLPTPSKTRAKLDDSDEDNNSAASRGKVHVTYRPAGITDSSHSSVQTLEIPLQPDVRGLETLDVTMHRSATKAYNMGQTYNDWFSECFGYRVVLAYLGPHSRRVLGSFPPGKSPAHRDAAASPVVSMRSVTILAGVTLLLNTVRAIPALTTGSLETITRADVERVLPSVVATLAAVFLSWLFARDWTRNRGDEKITFADTAPYMLASETSLDDVSGRLPEGEEMDVTKFRANIIVSGAEAPYEEDFWAEVVVGGGVKLLLTANCARCQSINVDYATGKMGTGESGNVLKKLMKDRRVDKGMKYSPVFGRYVFLDRGSENALVKVGDEVVVSRRIEERTTYDWPGLSTLK